MDSAVSTMVDKDLTGEDWREYEHGGVCYRITSPVKLFYRTGGTTHRIEDAAGIVHCHPAPGNGVALRWKPKDAANPVQF